MTQTNHGASLVYRFTADDAHMRTAIGIRKDSVIHVEERSGVALYGQYVPVPAGRYKASLQFSRDASCAGTAVMDVCAESGNRLLARKSVCGDDLISNDMSCELDFECADVLVDVEVRLISEGGFTAGIEGLQIVGNLADPYSRVQLSDLPSVPIENAFSRGRSLYDGYQRGVGLQFSGLSTKIAHDPDFVEATNFAGGRTILGEFNLDNIFLILKFYLPRLRFGHLVEFGSYMGGGAIFMAALARKFLPGRKVYAFDTFTGMPPTDIRVDHHQPGSFAGVDLPELHRYVREIGLENIEFVQGDFVQTAAPTLQGIGSVCFAHIDCDIRSAIQCAYDATKLHMISGGYWVLDDPMVADCLGAAEAMEDLLIRRDGLNSEQVFPHYVFRQPICE